MESSRTVALYKQSRGLSLRDSNVNLSAANNLFGSIGSSRLAIGGDFGFVPTDGQGGIMDLTGTNVDASWIGLSQKNMQFWAYNYCSPLASVIDRLAEAETNGRLSFIDSDFEPISNVNKIPRLARIRDLFANPNPSQTWEDHNAEQGVLGRIFGYCPVWVIGSSLIDPSMATGMVNLNPFFTQPIYNYQFNLEEGLDNENSRTITGWRVSILGKTYEIPSEEVIIIKDGFIDATNTPGLPLSKIAGLDYWVSNICAAMEADNVLLKKKGPLGVFSYEPKPDMAGWTPMSNKSKHQLQADLSRYGLSWSQLQYVISKTPIKWNAMSFNLRDLMTKETVRQGIDGICDRFGYPAELMSGKNATYENRNSAERFMYQTTVIPFSLRKMARYNKFFNLTNQKLIVDYNHLPVLQDDILKKGQTLQATSLGIQTLWQSGLLTWNECRTAATQDKVNGMDIYYNEYIVKYPPPATQKPTKPQKIAV